MKNFETALVVLTLKTRENIPSNYTGYIEWDNGTKGWYKEGRCHREDGPAVERADGTKYWLIEGEFHREDGPAVERADGTKSWYIRGKLHREDGPAVEWADGTKHWYIEGKYYSLEEDWKKKVEELQTLQPTNNDSASSPA